MMIEKATEIIDGVEWFYDQASGEIVTEKEVIKAVSYDGERVEPYSQKEKITLKWNSNVFKYRRGGNAADIEITYTIYDTRGGAVLHGSFKIDRIQKARYLLNALHFRYAIADGGIPPSIGWITDALLEIDSKSAIPRSGCSK